MPPARWFVRFDDEPILQDLTSNSLEYNLRVIVHSTPFNTQMRAHEVDGDIVAGSDLRTSKAGVT